MIEDEVEFLNVFMVFDKEKIILFVNKIFEKLEDKVDKNFLENSYKKFFEFILIKVKEICFVLKDEFIKSAVFFFNKWESENMKKNLIDFVFFCIDKI